MVEKLTLCRNRSKYLSVQKKLIHIGSRDVAGGSPKVDWCLKSESKNIMLGLLLRQAGLVHRYNHLIYIL